VVMFREQLVLDVPLYFIFYMVCYGWCACCTGVASVCVCVCVCVIFELVCNM